MTAREDIQVSEALRLEACAWVVRIQSGQATSTDTAELLRWRGQSPEHARALGEAVRLRRLMVDAGRAARTDASPDEGGFGLVTPSSSRGITSQSAARRTTGPRLSRRALLGGAIAASVGGVLVLRPPMDLWPSLMELRADYRTGVGERRTVALANDVSVDLNTRTSVALRSTAERDGLDLIAGEVIVNAEHATRAVVIKTSAGVATARVGRFGVRLNDGQACVTCLAGHVMVDAGRDEPIALSPGQQLTFANQIVEAIQQVNPDHVEAWRTGRLVFVDEPLGQVVDELNRYRPGKIILANTDLRARPINAIFLLDHLDNAVLQIREVTRAKTTQLPGGIVLLS